MEIRVEEHLTGQRLRDQILQRYGSRKRLVEVARGRTDPAARDDLFTLERLERDPQRLRATYRVATVAHLGADDVALLTPARLRLLEALGRRQSAPSLTELVAVLGRDKKNLSEDLRVLERLGLVRIGHEGRRLRPMLAAPEIHLVFSQPADEGPGVPGT